MSDRLRLPPAHIAGNLAWMRNGTVWAVWSVTPSSYPLLSEEQKLAYHGQLTRALSGLPEESLLIGVCAPITPEAVISAVASTVDDLERHPGWQRACLVAEAAIEGASGGSWERRFYLAVALPRSTVGEQIRQFARSASEPASRRPIKLIGPSAKERRTRVDQARTIRGRISLTMEPVDAGELRWLFARAFRRGARDLPLDASWRTPVAPGGSLESVDGVVVHEGGHRSDEGAPRMRRYLRIETEHGASYQVLMALSEMPHHFAFPGVSSEWLLRADDMAWPVDWAVRIRAIPNRIAREKARRQGRRLAGQYEEHEEDLQRIGAPPELDEAARAVDDQRQRLAENSKTPELVATVVYAVAGQDLGEVTERANTFTEALGAGEFSLHRPSGGQWGLFSAMLPGTIESQVVRDYRQHLLPEDLAMGAPFACADVGDDTGMLWAANASVGAVRPVLLNPDAGFRAGLDGSMAFVGMPGVGKSASMKIVTAGVLAMGGQAIVFDRTSIREWSRFARALDVEVADASLDPAASLSLDCFRVFTASRSQAAQHALGFATLLTGCHPQSLEGIALSEAITEVGKLDHPTLPAVLERLTAMGDRDADAKSAARKLAAFARSPLGGLAFDLSRPPLDLTADLIVLSAPDLPLPDREHLASDELSRRLLPEQVHAQALLYLVAVAMHAVTSADTDRLAVANLDEAWGLALSPEGAALLDVLARDGRKRHGTLYLGTQHPGDIRPSLAANISTRFVFAVRPEAASAALALVDMDDTPANRALVSVEMVRHDAPGADPAPAMALWRDVRGRLGLVHIYPPFDPELAEAIETNPIRMRRPGERYLSPVPANGIAGGVRP